MITGQGLLGARLPASLSIATDHNIGHVRSLAVAVANAQGFDQVRRDRVSLVAGEMAASLRRGARSGRIMVRLLERGEQRGVELVATDEGSGVEAELRDARSLPGGLPRHPPPEDGLGAVAHVSDLFDSYTAPGRGTVMMSRLWGEGGAAAVDGRFRIGSMVEALPGELVCGDAWAAEQSGTRVVVLVADGLGHGVEAAQASVAAVEAFRQQYREPVEDIVGHIHRALFGTRGAAIAVAEVDPVARRIRFCGIGNIAAHLLAGGRHHHLISHYGIAGYHARHIRAFDYVWVDGALLVMHSDGLSPLWDIDAYTGILGHHPQLAAATVMRDAPRAKDDALVLAVRGAQKDYEHTGRGH